MPETRQMGTFSNQNRLLWYQIDKITQDLGFQRVSDKSAKFRILPIFFLLAKATKIGIFKIFSNRSNMGNICSALMPEVTLWSFKTIGRWEKC